jgi:hypothetical protein
MSLLRKPRLRKLLLHRISVFSQSVAEKISKETPKEVKMGEDEDIFIKRN